MRRMTTAILLLLLCSQSFAADLKKGLEAYEAGDYAAALKEWKPLAEQGIADAQWALGLMYARGAGVIQDYAEAVKWYRLAAEQGDAIAQYGLGRMYADGKGVIQDNVYAHMWFNISASLGDEDAPKNRDSISKRMTSEQIAKAQELARECVKKSYKGC